MTNPTALVPVPSRIPAQRLCPSWCPVDPAVFGDMTDKDLEVIASAFGWQYVKGLQRYHLIGMIWLSDYNQTMPSTEFYLKEEYDR